MEGWGWGWGWDSEVSLSVPNTDGAVNVVAGGGREGGGVFGTNTCLASPLLELTCNTCIVFQEPGRDGEVS